MRRSCLRPCVCPARLSLWGTSTGAVSITPGTLLIQCRLHKTKKHTLSVPVHYIHQADLVLELISLPHPRTIQRERGRLSASRAVCDALGVSPCGAEAVLSPQGLVPVPLCLSEFLPKIGTHLLASSDIMEKNSNSCACLRNAGSYFAESYSSFKVLRCQHKHNDPSSFGPHGDSCSYQRSY